MKDLISQTIISSESVTHRNVSAAWSAGVEYEVQWQAVPWLRFTANGSFQNSKDETYMATLDYIPDNMFSGQAVVLQKVSKFKIEGQVGLNYVGQRSYLDFSKSQLLFMPDLTIQLRPLVIPLAPYTTVDMSCKFFPDERFWIALMVQNVLDIRYQEAIGTLAPGRFATIKAGWDF